MSYIMELRRTVGHRPLIMPCACLIIGDGRGNVLLQHRADDGKWANHGGAIELWETVEEALYREIGEELGVRPVEPRLLKAYSGPEFRHVYPNGDQVMVVDIVHWCHGFDGELRLQPEEVTEVRWFPLDRLPENILAHNLIALKDYGRLIGKECACRGE